MRNTENNQDQALEYNFFNVLKVWAYLWKQCLSHMFQEERSFSWQCLDLISSLAFLQKGTGFVLLAV